jgi:hypothetical protein
MCGGVNTGSRVGRQCPLSYKVVLGLKNESIIREMANGLESDATGWRGRATFEGIKRNR